ncbi:MAG: hypothetical protein WBD27_15975 [Pyrinomonadaceae bacterium]
MSQFNNQDIKPEIPKRLQEAEDWAKREREKFHEELTKEYEYQNNNGAFWMGIGFVFFSTVFIVSYGIGIISIAGEIIGVLLIGSSWRAGIFNRDNQ